ncbi:MAG: hypothetical protein J1F28_08965, partial [Oscillospiraceae bacterium]|nr:hypothetical protein [Oscillospiraceae bacterium]
MGYFWCDLCTLYLNWKFQNRTPHALFACGEKRCGVLSKREMLTALRFVPLPRLIFEISFMLEKRFWRVIARLKQVYHEERISNRSKFFQKKKFRPVR